MPKWDDITSLLSLAIDLMTFPLVDINECEIQTDDCHKNANCNDTGGSFDCTCLDGYEGDGVIQCASMTNLHIIG